MNPLVFLLLAGATVAVIAASSNTGPTRTDETASLVQDAQSMVDLFTFYSTKLGNLTTDQLNELAKLNAEAKGVPFKTIAEFLGDWARNPDERTNDELYNEYKQLYYLPPGTNTETGPDMFTEWSYSDTPSQNSWTLSDGPTVVCEQYFGYPDHPCYKGYFVDWFGRRVGTFQSDGTVWGHSDLMVIAKGYGKQFEDLWKAAGPDLLKSVADVASNYPGIGTAIASAVTFMSEIGSGASLENASIAAGRAAIPSSLRAAYDVGVGIAVNGELDIDAALSIAMAAAISNGVITGDVLEKYNTIKAAYEQTVETGKEIDGGLTTLKDAIQIAA